MEKVFLEILQNSHENTCARVYVQLIYNFIIKETLAKVFSYEFCKIKNTFFTEHLWATAPGGTKQLIGKISIMLNPLQKLYRKLIKIPIFGKYRFKSNCTTKIILKKKIFSYSTLTAMAKDC